MGTLAFIMFVGFALLSTTRGKEAETRQPASVETTKSEVIIDKQHDNVPNIVIKATGQTMSPPLPCRSLSAESLMPSKAHSTTHP
jgi:hypothetical protein